MVRTDTEVSPYDYLVLFIANNAIVCYNVHNRGKYENKEKYANNICHVGGGFDISGAVYCAGGGGQQGGF
jgi:hypothetical protein